MLDHVSARSKVRPEATVQRLHSNQRSSFLAPCSQKGDVLHRFALHLSTVLAEEPVGFGVQINNVSASLLGIQVVLGGPITHACPDQGLTAKGPFAHGNFAEEFEAAPPALHLAVSAGKLANFINFAPVPNYEVPASSNFSSVVEAGFQHLVLPDL